MLGMRRRWAPPVLDAAQALADRDENLQISRWSDAVALRAQLQQLIAEAVRAADGRARLDDLLGRLP